MEEVLTTKQPLVREKIDYLDKEIARLFEKVNSLEARLSPILSLDLPEPQKEALEEGKLPYAISSHLQKEINRICELQNHIERIKKRLEV